MPGGCLSTGTCAVYPFESIEGGPCAGLKSFIGMFGKRRHHTVRQYEQFIGKGVVEGRKPELTGGGLIRSAGGWHELSALRKMENTF